jgi:hypothetical protein
MICQASISENYPFVHLGCYQGLFGFVSSYGLLPHISVRIDFPSGIIEIGQKVCEIQPEKQKSC